MTTPSPRDAALIQSALLAWYREHKRSLPWRDDATPYHVWVSEVMLQQTRVEVVKDYFKRWVELFPDIAALARADESQVLHAWQGLGYYSRAKRLRQGAIFVRDSLRGQLPRDPERLQEIPGIGPYSAGAISSIAFQERAPLVDGNVIRVLTRLFALAGDPNKSPLKRTLWQVADALVPQALPGDFNQALMELGAVVCTPKKPACHACPLRVACRAHHQGETARFPEIPKRAPPTPITMVMLIAQHRGALAIEKLAPDARWWAGMDACPFALVEPDSGPLPTAKKLASRFGKVTNLEVLPPHAHTVTRFKIALVPVRATLAERKPAKAFRWVPRAKLHELALPAPHRKILMAHCS